MADHRITLTMDGNTAAAHIAYCFGEAAAVYPITPSSPMAELCGQWAAEGRKNIYGKPMKLIQMQSEAGAAAAVHGAALAGALAVTFTSSQGLLLMLPNLYRIAGELLPCVIHVAARTVATHALSIFGDHSDVYACRQTGAAIFACGSVQEIMDLAPAVHLASLKGSLPFLNFFDGFRTSHELRKIRVWDDEDLRSLLEPEALETFRRRALHPHHGRVYGSAQNPDIFFQNREASNSLYFRLPEIVRQEIGRINACLGTRYDLFDYYGAPDAEHVIVAMGSICETVREYLDYARDQKYGLLAVHLYRPFSVRHFLSRLPGSLRRLTVLDRTREPGAPGEPLYLDVVSALQQGGRLAPHPVNSAGSQADLTQGNRQKPHPADRTGSSDSLLLPPVKVFSGRYGLSSRDTTPAQIAAVYENRGKKFFTLGVIDDVTMLSLPEKPLPETVPADVVSCKFWGLGGDGTVSASKNALKIIGDHTDLNTQGYFEYDSKKSRGLTISHLRFGKSAIQSAYLIRRADLVACHNPVYLHKYKMAQELKDNGIFLLNSPGRGNDAGDYLPAEALDYMAAHHIRFFVIDALKIGKETGLNGKVSTILQAAFFAVSGLLPKERAIELMKAAARKSYGKNGEKIVRMNEEAIDRGFSEVRELQVSPCENPGTAPDGSSPSAQTPDNSCLCARPSSDEREPLDNAPLPDRPEILSYVRNIQQPVTDQRGSSLPVSAFLPYADGSVPAGTTAHERRNIATEIPNWIPENCIQCNRCSFVCPHAVIRPAVMTQEQLSAAPEGMKSLPLTGLDNRFFSVVVSQVDCTGCGSCAANCPGRQGKKALEMHPVQEDSPAAGILGDTPAQRCFDYAKHLLPSREAALRFGPDTPKGSQFLRPFLEFSGACSGCGETPYVKLLTQLFGPDLYLANATGCSSIWGNSSPSCAYCLDEEGHGPAWSNSLFEDAAEFGLGMALAGEVSGRPLTYWVVGGDGWAYDIGFGGLDHVLSTGKNINLLVLDTEVYSNTGGQASKATPLGATAKFLSGGKKTRKKDLASMAMTYGNVYVAQIAYGADFGQTVKALSEAAAYDGPSLVIAYATCIAHGIRAGLGSSAEEMKKAVDSGYFHLFRFHPLLKEQGKNPLVIDSKEPTLDYQSFLEGEIRYDSLRRSRPEEAEELSRIASAQAKERYRYLKGLEALYAPKKTEPDPPRTDR